MRSESSNPAIESYVVFWGFMKFKAQNGKMHSEKLNIDFSFPCLMDRLNDNTFLMKLPVLSRAIIAFDTSDPNQIGL